MSACATENRRILLNITNMEGQDDKASMEKVSGGIDGVRDMKDVKAGPTPAASSLSASKQLSRSAGENSNNGECLNGTCPKNLIRTTGKFESGSGSGDQEGGQLEDGTDIAAKKRKTRRGKPKHRKLKPYSKQQLSYQQQLKYKCKGRLPKTGRQPPAPYNTTQFLMNDHSDLPDLEQKLSEAAASEVSTTFPKPAPARTRDSSFSVDSDEDYFYSSPEDEEEFLTKEFFSAYEDLHAERLNTLTKSELIQEYIQLEAKVDVLTKRLRAKNFHQMEDIELESRNGNATDTESAKKLKICQQRIDDLIQQNEQLRRENETLRAQRHRSPVSSVDSESDSDSSSNSNRSRCSCPLSSASSSPEHMGYNSRHDCSHRKDNTVSSSNCKTDSCNSSPKGSPKCTSPSNLSNGHVTIDEEEIDDLPT